MDLRKALANALIQPEKKGPRLPVPTRQTPLRSKGKHKGWYNHRKDPEKYGQKIPPKLTPFRNEE